MQKDSGNFTAKTTGQIHESFQQWSLVQFPDRVSCTFQAPLSLLHHLCTLPFYSLGPLVTTLSSSNKMVRILCLLHANEPIYTLTATGSRAYFSWPTGLHLAGSVLPLLGFGRLEHCGNLYLLILLGFPTLVTPTHYSDVLREWIGELTAGDHEGLRLWGISSKFLNVAKAEVSRHL